MTKHAPRPPRALPPLADVVIEGAALLGETLFVPNGERIMDLVRVVAVRAKGYKGKPGVKVTPTVVKDITWHLRSYDQEVVLAILLDGQQRLIGLYEHGLGGTSSAPVEPYHLLKMALLTGAAGMLLVHNHPGGRSGPSEDDIEMTINVDEVLRAFGISLVGHFVVSDDGMSELVAPYKHRITRLHPGRVGPKWVEAVAADAQGFTPYAPDPYGKYRTFLVSAGLVRSNVPSARTLSRTSLGGPSAMQAVAAGVLGLKGASFVGVAVVSLDVNLHPRAVELVSVNAEALADDPSIAYREALLAGVLLSLLTGGVQYVVLVIDPSALRGDEDRRLSLLGAYARAARNLPERGVVRCADVILASATESVSAHLKRIL
jgi:DNA repair protein RadC